MVCSECAQQSSGALMCSSAALAVEPSCSSGLLFAFGITIFSGITAVLGLSHL